MNGFFSLQAKKVPKVFESFFVVELKIIKIIKLLKNQTLF
jgi:hypothetical protein